MSNNTAFSEPDCDVRRTLTATGPDGRTFTVVAVKRGMTLREGVVTGSTIIELLLGLVLEVIIEARARRSTQWKVGALRHRWAGTRVTHKEKLPAGIEPNERMADLVRAIEAGRPIA